MAARLDPVADAKAKDTEDAKDKETPPAKDAKNLGQQVFRNASWEVTLKFDKDDKNQTRISPDSRIKNVHVSHREQDLGNPTIDGVFFRLIQGETRKTFYFQGPKVPWDKDAPLGNDKSWPMPSVNPTKPVELEQVFDRSNTPIASIDEIRIPYLSNRNANRPLVAAKPSRFGKKEEPAADPTKVAPPGAGAMGSMPPGGPGIPPMSSGMIGGPMYGMQTGGKGASGGLGGAQGSANVTPNFGFDRERYLFVTDQSRHLPLAMTLAVDQSHLNEILVALANSKLRFQTTQVEFRREPAGASANSTAGNGFPQPGSGGLTPSSPPGEDFRRTPAVPPGGIGMMSPDGTASTAPTPASDNPNLVELTVYGIASLYERPSEKPAEEKK